jgi:hypothetical protein
MRTTILAYVITVLGLAMIGGGAWGLIDLWQHQSAQVHVPLRYYGMAIGMICGGFGMGGIAQGLRMLVAIAGETQGLHMLLRAIADADHPLIAPSVPWGSR